MKRVKDKEGKRERKEGRLFPRAATWYTHLLSLCRMRADRVAIADERPVCALSLSLSLSLYFSLPEADALRSHHWVQRCTSSLCPSAVVTSTNYYHIAFHCCKRTVNLTINIDFC